MENILSAEKEVLLRTSLDEMMFAKTKFSSLMYEKGYIAESDGTDGGVRFSEWTFSGTKTIDGTVYFSGEGFTGTAVSELPEKNVSNDEIKQILFAICRAYDCAQKQDIQLPCAGPSAVLYDEKTKRLLFVPQKTFGRSCANLGKEQYNLIIDPWCEAAFSGNRAMNFTRAVYIYFAFTKNLPYPAGTETDKSVSIAYRNFCPLELCVNGIDRTLAAAINSALCGKNAQTDFPMKALEEELFRTEPRKKIMSDDLFEKSAELYMKKLANHIQKKQRFNRRAGTVIAAAAIILFITIFIINAVLENRKKPTVIGLSSLQTTAIFYAGIHRMDTDYMLAAAENCPQAQGYISRVPQIFVTTQMKAAYNFESGMSTPENWMFFEPDSTRAYSHSIYGITNFTADGIPSTLTQSAPSLRNHPPKLTHAGEERLTEFSRAQHTAHYYLVHTVDNMIVIEEFTTVVELKYTGKKWQIAFLNETSSKDTLSPLTFSLDLKEALEKCGGNTVDAVDQLREKYPWVPTRESMLAEEARLDAIGY